MRGFRLNLALAPAFAALVIAILLSACDDAAEDVANGVSSSSPALTATELPSGTSLTIGPSSTPVATEWKTYSDDQFRLSFSYPAGWNVSKAPPFEGGVSITVANYDPNKDRPERGQGLALEVHSNPSNLNASQWLDNELASGFCETEILSTEEWAVGALLGIIRRLVVHPEGDECMAGSSFELVRGAVAFENRVLTAQTQSYHEQPTSSVFESITLD
jgi:hypothetical protein